MTVSRFSRIVVRTTAMLAGVATAALGVSACGDGDSGNDTPGQKTTTSSLAPSPSSPSALPSPAETSSAPTCDFDGSKPENAVAPNFNDPGFRADHGKKILMDNGRTLKLDTQAGGDASVVWAGDGTDPIPNRYTLNTTLNFDVDAGGARAAFSLLADGKDPVVQEYEGGGRKGSMFVGVETGPSGSTVYYGVYGNRDGNNPLLDGGVTERGFQALVKDPTSWVESAPYDRATPLDVRIVTGENASITVGNNPTTVIPPGFRPTHSMFPALAARDASGGSSAARMTVTSIEMRECITVTKRGAAHETTISPEAVNAAVQNGSYAGTQVTNVQTFSIEGRSSLAGAGAGASR